MKPLISIPSLLLLLAFSSVVPALNKGTTEDQPSLPGLVDKIIPALQENTAPPPPVQPEPQSAAQTPPKEKSSFTVALDKLSKARTLLEEEEKNAKLRESIKQHGGNVEAEQTTTSVETGSHKFNVRLIYGVGGLYHAIIVNNGVELTVGQGTEIDGDWKVASISATTVRLKDKDGNTLNLGLSGRAPEQKTASVPQQAQQQIVAPQPIMPKPIVQQLPGQ